MDENIIKRREQAKMRAKRRSAKKSFSLPSFPKKTKTAAGSKPSRKLVRNSNRPAKVKKVRSAKSRYILRKKIEIAVITFLTVAILLGGVTWRDTIQPRGGFLWIRSEVTGGAIVSDRVLEYEQTITDACAEQDLTGYEGVIMAIMQQESGGKGTDVMQCSECYLNTDYPQKPGAILDPAYSIKVGVAYFKECLELASCKSVNDTRRLRLALQGYNFGHAYISWALERYGGYSPENAREFSEMMAEKMEWSGYGDKYYVDHVLRYYK